MILLFFSLQLSAAHLVGGEISYECTGNNNYKITLKVYRDCNSSGAPFDPNANIAIYIPGSNLTPYTQINPAPSSTINIPAVVNNPCLQTPPNVCTQLATYVGTVNLPPNNLGYIVSYQRCCRNQTISNVTNPGVWGSTYTVRIPPNDTACNSSPEFTSNPPIVLCNNDPLNINSAATEFDGDSVYYELCELLHGGSQTIPRPVPSGPPPYLSVPFTNPYTATNPIPSSPQFQINSATGVITGTPTQTGQYVVGICATEYRNGVYLSTVRRDYQFNVTNCQSNVTANITSNALYCTGKTVTFINNSINATNSFWDFGVAGSTNDTSVQIGPTFTYPDTGTYTVMLIVNKGWPCSDTTFRTITVRYPADASYMHEGSYCENIGEVFFQPTSNNSPIDVLTWDFGPNATPATFTGFNPPPVVFSSAGPQTVKLHVNSFGCETTFYDTVDIFMNPIIDFDIPVNQGCAPFTLRFQDKSQSSNPLNYQWDFGDGNTSTDPSPIHTYQNPGVYDVTLVIYTAEGCLDTLELFEQGAILVKPTPISRVDVTPLETTIYESLVTVTDLAAEPGERITTFMGDGQVYENQHTFDHTYRDTGVYEVMHIVTNTAGCADTTIVIVEILPEPLLFIPNAFSPNGDGRNDVFKPSVVGQREYEFIVFSRWGDIVFKTNNPYIGWNGNDHNDGAVLPQGVYTYTVHVRYKNDRITSEKGQITLFR